MSAPIKKERRYIVFKIADLDPETLAVLNQVEELVARSRVRVGKLPRQFLVVESDWPEYETTWQAIKTRMEARNPCARVDRVSAAAKITPDNITWADAAGILDAMGLIHAYARFFRFGMDMELIFSISESAKSVCRFNITAQVARNILSDIQCIHDLSVSLQEKEPFGYIHRICDRALRYVCPLPNKGESRQRTVEDFSITAAELLMYPVGFMRQPVAVDEDNGELREPPNGKDEN